MLTIRDELGNEIMAEVNFDIGFLFFMGKNAQPYYLTRNCKHIPIQSYSYHFLNGIILEKDEIFIIINVENKENFEIKYGLDCIIIINRPDTHYYFYASLCKVQDLWVFFGQENEKNFTPLTISEILNINNEKLHYIFLDSEKYDELFCEIENDRDDSEHDDGRFQSDINFYNLKKSSLNNELKCIIELQNQIKTVNKQTNDQNSGLDLNMFNFNFNL